MTLIKKLLLLFVIISFNLNIIGCSAIHYHMGVVFDLEEEQKMLSETDNWISIIPGSEVSIALEDDGELVGILESADSLGLIIETNGEEIEIPRAEIAKITVISEKSNTHDALIVGLTMDIIMTLGLITMAMGGM